MGIKQLRLEKRLTQEKCASYLGIPIRTFKRYESNESVVNRLKYENIINRLNEYGIITEDHGVLSIDQIKQICSDVFKTYDIEFCYLFGSYAKGTENEKSDVDLLVSMPVDGLKFYELIETLREKLHKKVDLLNFEQLNNNTTLVKEIMKDGIRIYG